MADYYTLQELAVKLGVSHSTIARMLKREELKEGDDFYRVGRSIRFIKKAMMERFHLTGE